MIQNQACFRFFFAFTVSDRRQALLPSRYAIQRDGSRPLEHRALSMEVAIPFDTNAQDEDTELAFREALAPKLKAIDASALRAGHWA